MGVLVQQLNTDRAIALRNNLGVVKSILSVLLSDAQSIAKKATREVEDEDIQKSAKSITKKIEETIKIATEKGYECAIEKYELEILKKFLPPTMSYVEIHSAVIKTINENGLETIQSNFPNIMKAIKKVKGIDIEVAVSVVRELIATTEKG